MKYPKNNDDNKPIQINGLPGLFAFDSLGRNETLEKNIINFIYEDAKLKSKQELKQNKQSK